MLIRINLSDKYEFIYLFLYDLTRWYIPIAKILIDINKNIIPEETRVFLSKYISYKKRKSAITIKYTPINL